MEKTILEKNLILTEADHQTNVPISFRVIHPAEKLIIEFSYSPQNVEETEARSKIKKALKQFVPEAEQKKWGNADRFLPLQNLITLSLDFEEEYIGARHKKAAHQAITVSEQESSKGFVKRQIEAGDWIVQLNAHCIASPEVTVTIQVRVEEGAG